MPALLLSLILFSLKGFAGIEPPKVNVVKGCPCLDCPYFVKGQSSGVWRARKEVPIFATPKGFSQQVAVVQEGETVMALAGEIYVTPGELKVAHDHGRFKKGDLVYILQEDAEAKTWKVWHNGTEYFEDLSALVSGKEPCKKPDAKCWAKVLSPLKSKWWVNLQTKGKRVGWTNATDDFDFDRSSCM